MIQWVYEHYGRDRAALCATIIRYRARGAMREVGKVLGLTEDVTGALASQVWGWSEEGVEAQHAEALNLNLGDRRLRLALDLAQQLIGFPRHLGQHPGGFVLTRDKLADLVPIEPATHEGPPGHRMGQGRHRRAEIHEGRRARASACSAACAGPSTCWPSTADTTLDLFTIPQDDAATYAMIQRADTLGTFQIESRAQMSMLPRMKPKTLYDLTIQVAIVRPGPIQGDMVHPYLRRREGLEPVDYPQPGTAPGARQDARRAAVPGTGDAGRHPMRRLHAGRGRPAPPLDGDLQGHRRRAPFPGQADPRA